MTLIRPSPALRCNAQNGSNLLAPKINDALSRQTNVRFPALFSMFIINVFLDSTLQTSSNSESVLVNEHPRDPSFIIPGVGGECSSKTSLARDSQSQQTRCPVSVPYSYGSTLCCSAYHYSTFDIGRQIHKCVGGCWGMLLMYLDVALAVCNIDAIPSEAGILAWQPAWVLQLSVVR
ncbi:hypothetical protein EJ06DRAFT_67362 [Trichodelitschia bisporula]|uniref:Uncharacterized protein n=1 Tax=Trichodelitschia bisporula TaxID=703511 RepID=A0A6G1HT24_9PEZI|nr:hypothetical protein EJ06DRAFT_67362 [Trichodelitschia bisporula]